MTESWLFILLLLKARERERERESEHTEQVRIDCLNMESLNMESLLRLKVSDVEESYRKQPAKTVQGLANAKLHPRYSALLEEGEAWSEARIAPVLSEAAIEKLRSTNCVALACYMWPNAEGVRALTLVKFCYWLILFDDVADDPLAMGGDTERLRRFCCHFLHVVFGSGDAQPISDFNAEELLAVELGREWWGEMTRSGAETMMPLGLQARVAEAMTDYVMAQLPCAELRAQWEVWLGEAASGGATVPPCTLEELVLLLRVASSVLVVLLLVEYDLGVELDNKSLASPLVQQLINTMADHLVWVNNIFSLPKDLQKQETLNFLTLFHLDGSRGAPLPFHVTLAQAWDIAAKLERDGIGIAARITTQLDEFAAAAQQYADALCTFIPSHLRWCQQTTRYPGTQGKLGSLDVNAPMFTTEG